MDLLYYYEDGSARREVYDSNGLSFVVRYHFGSLEEAQEFALKNGAVLVEDESIGSEVERFRENKGE